MLKHCYGALIAATLLFGSWAARAEPTRILASVRPVTLLVQELVGEHAQVDTLVPASADPHNFALRVSDLQKIAQADLIIWLGPDFERFLERGLTQKTPEQQLRLTELSNLAWPEMYDKHDLANHLAHGQGHSHDHDRDPHIWLTPHNAAVILQAAHDRVSALRPEAQEALTQRLQVMLAELAALHTRIKEQLAPYRNRGFGVHHNAYSHYVAAYNLQQLGHTNNLPEERLGARQLQRLKLKFQEAHCFLVEGEGHGVQRLAQLFDLPLVVADPLAADPTLQTYNEFLQQLTNAFVDCLRGPANDEPRLNKDP